MKSAVGKTISLMTEINLVIKYAYEMMNKDISF